MNVAAMSEAAKNRAQTFKTVVTNQKDEFDAELATFKERNATIMNMPTDPADKLGEQKTAVANLHDDMEKFCVKVKSETDLVKDNVQTAKQELDTTNTLVENLESSDYNDLNLTSKQLLEDSASNYKQTFIAVCIKAGICLIAIYMLLPFWVDIIVVFFGIIIVWILFTGISYTWEQATKKKGDTKLVGATDTTKSSTYSPPTKVCRNGEPDTGSCATENLCWGTTYGCCANGQDPMKSADDECGLKPCQSSKFGCCPNGAPKLDQMGSNCNSNAVCGLSPWGCNEDTSFRTG
jgi:hypothetical protein